MRRAHFSMAHVGVVPSGVVIFDSSLLGRENRSRGGGKNLISDKILVVEIWAVCRYSPLKSPRQIKIILFERVSKDGYGLVVYGCCVFVYVICMSETVFVLYLCMYVCVYFLLCLCSRTCIRFNFHMMQPFLFMESMCMFYCAVCDTYNQESYEQFWF